MSIPFKGTQDHETFTKNGDPNVTTTQVASAVSTSNDNGGKNTYLGVNGRVNLITKTGAKLGGMGYTFPRNPGSARNDN